MNGTTLIIILILIWLFPLGQAGLATAVEIDLTGFGEAGYRSTNLYEERYDFAGGWAEARIAARNLIAYSELIGVTPFAKGVLSWTNHTELPEENMFIYGGGLEFRLLLDSDTHGGWANWLNQLRLYGEYLEAKYLRREVGSWVPRTDWRFGVEIWKEINVEVGTRVINPKSVLDYTWAEIWSDVGWRKSTFFRSDFESGMTALVLRLGLWFPKLVPSRDIFLMPYATLDHASSQWRYAWQNRALGGFGLRMMPFPHSLTPWLRRLRLFAEYVWVAGYYCDQPVEGTPDYDVRVGVNFSNTWR